MRAEPESVIPGGLSAVWGQTTPHRAQQALSSGRAPRPISSVLAEAIALTAVGMSAVGIIVSAVLVVARGPADLTGVVVPVIPITTTTAAPVLPPPPTAPAPTQAPSRIPASTPPAIITTVAPSAPPPPAKPAEPRPTRPPRTSAPPSSVHPTLHRAFPQETTDFPGPPGTNG
jgi:hypothetical protein